MGLMFNAILKIPMQFFILLTGVLVYVFYIFYQPPLHFKEASVAVVESSEFESEYQAINDAYQEELVLRETAAKNYAAAVNSQDQEQYLSDFQSSDDRIVQLRSDAKDVLLKADESIETKDSDYVFLTFIINYLPHGLVGLLIAVIFSAAMSSTSSELNALASTTSVDFYKRAIKKDGSDQHYVNTSKLLTFVWGVLAILFAILAKNSENLIEAVNIAGSIFYGTILGIFLVAFFLKWVQGNAVFVAALIAQSCVIVIHFLTEADYFKLSYLWYNVVGCGGTFILSMVLQFLMPTKKA